ncbi:MAG TPA: hypothetical protein PKL84_17450, partial [Candidatus Hydrogenedentes bacterium]|nr:hypothetical protein [Candidatus Hydrogenedentota bacterium]
MKYRLGLVLLAVAALFAAVCWLLALWRPYLGAAVFIVVFGGVLLFYLLTLRRVRGQWFDSGGVRIHYTDEGDGEPVILIHGLAVNADINWRVPGVIRML